MIDLEFSKYYLDDRATPYGPYRCTCAPRAQCQACKDNCTAQIWSAGKSRRPAVENRAERRAALRAFAAQWMAAYAQLPLPGEILAACKASPRPAWVPAMSLLYYAYGTYGEFHADCVAHGIGTPQLAQEADTRLAQQRDATRRQRKHRRTAQTQEA